METLSGPAWQRGVVIEHRARRVLLAHAARARFVTSSFRTRGLQVLA
jgi:hypothetical protein